MIRYVLKDTRTGHYYRHSRFPRQPWTYDINKATLFETIGGAKRSTAPWRCKRINGMDGKFSHYHMITFEELGWFEIVKISLHTGP